MERRKKRNRTFAKNRKREPKKGTYEIWVCVITFCMIARYYAQYLTSFFILFASNQTQNGNFILHFPPLLRKIDQKFEFFVSTFWVSSHCLLFFLFSSVVIIKWRRKAQQRLKICGKGIRNVSRCFWMSIKRHKWDKNNTKKSFFFSLLLFFLHH